LILRPDEGEGGEPNAEGGKGPGYKLRILLEDDQPGGCLSPLQPKLNWPDVLVARLVVWRAVGVGLGMVPENTRAGGSDRVTSA